VTNGEVGSKLMFGYMYVGWLSELVTDDVETAW
jgi:hypothetical protein